MTILDKQKDHWLAIALTWALLTFGATAGITLLITDLYNRLMGH